MSTYLRTLDLMHLAHARAGPHDGVIRVPAARVRGEPRAQRRRPERVVPVELVPLVLAFVKRLVRGELFEHLR